MVSPTGDNQHWRGLAVAGGGLWVTSGMTVAQVTIWLFVSRVLLTEITGEAALDDDLL